MKKWKTKTGYEVIRVISGRSNAYLISTEKGNILVDTGWKHSFDGLQRNISSLGLSQPITFLILTHTHFDHCYNVARIWQQDKSIILMSEVEANFVQQGYTPIPEGTLRITNYYHVLVRLSDEDGLDTHHLYLTE